MSATSRTNSRQSTSRDITGNSRYSQYTKETTRPKCNKCSSCIQIRNIHEHSHEATPLLASSLTTMGSARLLDKLLLLGLILLFVFGAIFGLYLLFTQYQSAVIEEFDFVSRDNWMKNSSFLLNVPPIDPPVSKIVLQGLASNCTDPVPLCLRYEEFEDSKKEKIRILDGQVLYNFYQDRHGTIFEGRGFNYQSECGQVGDCDRLYTIGILEDGTMRSLGKRIKKLRAFLDYAVSEEVLDACYEVVVSHQEVRYFDDLALLLSKTKKYHQNCKYYY